MLGLTHLSLSLFFLVKFHDLFLQSLTLKRSLISFSTSFYYTLCTHNCTLNFYSRSTSFWWINSCMFLAKNALYQNDLWRSLHLLCLSSAQCNIAAISLTTNANTTPLMLPSQNIVPGEREGLICLKYNCSVHFGFITKCSAWLQLSL